MSVLSRLADARNTAEGKALSVIMASLLVVSTFNVTAWAADTAEEKASKEVPMEVNDKQEPAKAAESEQPAAEPEKKPEAKPEPETPAPKVEAPAEKPTAPLENPTERPEAEQPAKAPAAPAEDEAPSTVALKLKVVGAALAHDGKPVAADAQELVVPAGKDVKFTVEAAEGLQLTDKSVQLVSPAGVECTLAPNAAGEYVIAAEKAEAGATLVVAAAPIVAEEPEAPADDPETPANPEPTEKPSVPATPEAPSIPSAPTTEQPGILDDFLNIFNGSSTLNINGGKDIALTAGESKSVRSDNDTHWRTKDHSWKSSDESVARVEGNESSATVIGVSGGTATITHSYKHKSLLDGWQEDVETITVTVNAASAPIVTYSPNGGQGSDVQMEATWGSVLERYAVTLPVPNDIGFSREGYTFVGWSTVSTGRGDNYGANTEFVMTGDTTLYAIWMNDENAASSGTDAYFYIRKDGAIQKEPAGYSGDSYNPADKDGDSWALKGSLRQPVAVNNNLAAVNANLKNVPSDKRIQEVLAHYGVSFDPETQYVQWYVIKARGDKEWNVDGVIQDKSKGRVTYEANGGVGNKVPAAEQYAKGVTVAVSFGADANHTPVRTGYVFLGWDENSKAHVPTYSPEGLKSFTMPDHDVTLYAIWQERDAVRYTYEASPKEAGKVSCDFESVKPATGNPLGSTATAEIGYTFDGWYVSSEKITEDNAAQHNVTLTNGGATLTPIKNASELYEGGDFVAKFTANKNAFYVVNYLEEGTNKVLADQKQVGDLAFGTTETETALDIAGYKPAGLDQVAKTVTAGYAPGNEITFYYVVDEDKTKDLEAVVAYLLDGVEQTRDRQALSATVQVLQGDDLPTAGVTEKAYEGWKLDNITVNGEVVAALPATVPNGAYVAYNYVVDEGAQFAWRINYLEQGTNEVVAPAVEGTGYLTQVLTRTNPAVYGFSVADGSASASVTIAQTEGVNEATVYYVRDSFTIAATIDSNGTIAGEDSQTVPFQGASQAISFSANPGYRIDSVVVTETTADGEITRNLMPTGTALDYTLMPSTASRAATRFTLPPLRWMPSR